MSEILVPVDEMTSLRKLTSKIAHQIIWYFRGVTKRILILFSQSVDINSTLDGLNVSFSSIQIYSPDLQQQLVDIREAVNISFQDFYTEV